MTTVANTGSTSDPYRPPDSTRSDWTGDTLVVPPSTASGWTGGRMVALVPGSLLALLGLAALERRQHTGTAIGLLAGGVVLLAGGAVLVILAARSAGDGR